MLFICPILSPGSGCTIWFLWHQWMLHIVMFCYKQVATSHQSHCRQGERTGTHVCQCNGHLTNNGVNWQHTQLPSSGFSNHVPILHHFWDITTYKLSATELPISQYCNDHHKGVCRRECTMTRLCPSLHSESREELEQDRNDWATDSPEQRSPSTTATKQMPQRFATPPLNVCFYCGFNGTEAVRFILTT